jgi:hypothetical protein
MYIDADAVPSSHTFRSPVRAAADSAGLNFAAPAGSAAVQAAPDDPNTPDMAEGYTPGTNVIERAVVLSTGEEIQPEDLAVPTFGVFVPTAGASHYQTRLEGAEKGILLQP